MFIVIAIPLLVLGQKEDIKKIQKLIDAKQPDEALANIYTLLEQNPSSNNLYYLKASSEYDKNEFSKSIESINKGLMFTKANDTLMKEMLGLRALGFSKTNDWGLAIKDAILISELFPSDIDNLMNLSYFSGESKDYYLCIYTLQKALKLEATNIYVLNNLAYFNNQWGDYPSGIKYSKLGLEFVKDSLWRGCLMNNLGYGLFKSGEVKSGLKFINESLIFHPVNSYAYYNRALIYINDNNIPLACKDLQKCKNLGGINLTTELINKYCK